MSVIETVQLKKQYNGSYVLKGIDLQIEPGMVLGYIGPNGAGKSTTIKIITGIIDEFEGEVKVLGMDVRKEPLEVKRRIGYIPETAAMYDTLTPVEYLKFTGKLYGLSDEVIAKKGWELLKLFDLSSKAEMRMNTYSKGMRQKVLLISGLMHNPEIIFLDEPLNGLDANAVILVKEILQQLKQSGKTIFYSSHIMDVVEKISDRIILIDGGQIIADGTIETLKEQAQQGSLENIFKSLTASDTETTNAAKEIIDVLKS